MMRFIMALVFVSWGAAALAQDPVVEVEFETAEAIPGQSLLLRVTVLVPTWMPKPVVFPSFEAPNLRIRLPEQSTSPTSKTIDGESWSGVSRRLQVAPMVPGQFEISQQELIVTWAEPGKPDPLVKTVLLDPIQVTGSVPAGAEDLDPFVAAEALDLSSAVSEATMPLKAGDSVNITVTAKVDGTSPMFLPPLIPPVQIDGVAAYPAEPAIEESENRGKLSGTRVEGLTLVAEAGGSGAVPEISLRWYNLKTKQVETATVEGFDVSVDAPSAARQNLSPRLLMAGIVASLLALLLIWWGARKIIPLLRQWLDARRQRIEASEHHAFEILLKAVADKDFGGMMQALDHWSERMPHDPRQLLSLQSALSALGAARYGPEKTQEDVAWEGVKAAVSSARAEGRMQGQAARVLPPLNPRNVSP